MCGPNGQRNNIMQPSLQIHLLTVRFGNMICSSIPLAVRLSWLENAHSHPLFQWAILTRKVCHIDLVFWHAIKVH